MRDLVSTRAPHVPRLCSHPLGHKGETRRGFKVWALGGGLGNETVKSTENAAKHFPPSNLTKWFNVHLE